MLINAPIAQAGAITRIAAGVSINGYR